VGVSATLIASALCGAPASGGSTPNVVVICADDAGYNEFGFTGSSSFQTPNLDALADGGIRFTNGYVCSPTCSPSRAGFMTGLSPQRFGYERNISNDVNGVDALSAEQSILTQWFHDLGYTTGVIGKWHLGAVDGVNRPLDKGVDEFFGLLGGSRPYWGGVSSEDKILRRGNDPVEDAWVNEGDSSGYDPVYGRYITDAFGDEAVSFIDAHHADPDPFFLYLSFTAPHTPLQAKQQDLIQFPNLSGETQVRAAMTLAMDRAIGKLLDALSNHGIDDNTIVVFFNDNGGPSPHDNSPFRGFKGETWEGGIRVPFLLHHPGLPGGIDDDRPVSTLDLAPTLVAAGGGSIPATDGVDLLPYLTGQLQGDPHATLFWRKGWMWAVREGDWKLVSSDRAGPIELFDLGTDPGETIDLAPQYGTIVDNLLRKLTVWETELDKPGWGAGGDDDRNLFDHFRYAQNDIGRWGHDWGWRRGDTQQLVSMLTEDAYANAILEFPVASSSYEARNNMTRMTGQTFMLNEIRFTGEFAGAHNAAASITGNPILFTRNLSGAGPRIQAEATSAGTGSFAFDLQTIVHLVDDLEITGEGTQPLVLSGAIEEARPGRGLVKTGDCSVTLTGPCQLAGDLIVDEGRFFLDFDTGSFGAVTVGTLGATLHVSDGATLIANTVDILAEGVLEGDGTVQGTIDCAGTIRPGSPMGTLTVEGDLTTTGELQIEIANAEPGSCDTVAVIGDAVIGGTLTVTFLDNFAHHGGGGIVPQTGDAFEILTANAVSGTFSSAALPDLPSPLVWNVIRDAHSVTLLVSRPWLGHTRPDGGPVPAPARRRFPVSGP
jgi:arylsulfatase A-like enzyme